MRRFLPILFVIGLLSCGEKSPEQRPSVVLQSELFLSDTLPPVPPRDSLITLLDNFIATKNDNPKLNPYWYPADFERYVYPYYDWYALEFGGDGEPCCSPTLLDIEATNDPAVYLLELAYHGEDVKGEDRLRQQGYLLAQRVGERWLLRRPLDYFTRDWAHHQVRNVEYYVSPQRELDYEDALAFNAFGDSLATFFRVDPIAVTYYSCMNPVELFNIRGVTENDQMHFSETGGQNEVWSNILYSGSNSDRYDHELVHSYTNRRFAGSIHRFVDEGLATYLGGSNGEPYTYHRAVLAEYLTRGGKDMDLLEHLDPHETLDLNGETSLAYTLGALCCERAMRKGGQALLWSICETGKNADGLWEALGQLGLDETNFNTVMREEVERSPLLLPWVE